MKKKAPGLIIILLLLCLAFSDLHAAQPSRLAGKDYVRITKITPRTGAEVFIPSHFPYSIEVKWQVVNIPKAQMTVSIYEGSEREPLRKKLIAPVSRTLSKGSGTLTIRTPYVNVQNAERSSKILVIVSLRKPGGKELAYSQSFNHVRRGLKVKMSSLAPTGDSIRLLDYSPRETTKLQPGQNQSFSFKLAYSLKSRKTAFLNIEFGDASTVGTGFCWNAMVVPLEQGTGVVQIDTDPMFFPAALAGKNMGIAMLYRLDPLGGTVSIVRINAYKFHSPTP